MIAVGFFFVWLSIFYYLMDTSERQLCRAAIWVISGIAMANFFVAMFVAGHSIFLKVLNVWHITLYSYI